MIFAAVFEITTAEYTPGNIRERNLQLIEQNDDIL